MLLTILGISILMIILGTIGYQKTKKFYNLFDDIQCVGFVFTGISILAVVIMSILISCFAKSADKIVLYEEENTRIETTINDIADSYKTYEQETFEKITNPEVLIQMYPELKTNEIVNIQMQTYLENHKKIIELKEELIETDVLRWWLYFGGE